MDYLPNGCTEVDGHDGPHVCSNPDSHTWGGGDMATYIAVTTDGNTVPQARVELATFRLGGER
jgi:hypothetical protein